MAAAVVNIAELATQFDEEVEYIWTCVFSLQIQLPPAHRSIIRQPHPQHKPSEGYVHLRAILSLFVVLVSGSRQSREGYTDRLSQCFAYGDLFEHVEPARRSKENVALWLLYKTCALQTLLWSIDFALLKRGTRPLPSPVECELLTTSSLVHLLFGGTRKILLLVSALGLGKLCLDVVIAFDIYSIMLANITGIYPSPTKPLVIFAYVTFSMLPMRAI